MSKSFHPLVVSSRIVAVLIAGAALAHAQSSPVVFQGLPHTAVGYATLQLDPTRGALDVFGLGPAGTDGVSVKKEGATSWTARVEVPAAGMPLNLSWSALADGRRIGSGLLRQKGDTFEMGGVFTGATTTPTFSAQVYNNGRLVGAVGGQPPDGRIFVPVNICTWVPELCRIAIEFQTLDDGACMVKIVGSQSCPHPAAEWGRRHGQRTAPGGGGAPRRPLSLSELRHDDDAERHALVRDPVGEPAMNRRRHARPFRRAAAAVIVLGAATVFSAVAATQSREEYLGGDTTVFDEGPTAFGRALANLDPLRWNEFRAGKERFLRQWPERGPWADAVSCAECHYHDGRGPRADHVGGPVHLVRLGGPSPGGDPVYGIQLRRTGYGVPAPAHVRVEWEEIRDRYPDGDSYELRRPTIHVSELAYGPLDPQTRLSLRVPPAVFGLGLLEAVSDQEIRRFADPDDADGDGVSGAVQEVRDAVTGRTRAGALRLESIAAVARRSIRLGAHRRRGRHTAWRFERDRSRSREDPGT